MAAQELPKLHCDIIGAAPSEHKEPMAMMMSFEIYSQIICASAPPTTVLDLHYALVDYRLTLHELVGIYIFQSVVNFHIAFIQTRIFRGQDNPQGWRESLMPFYHKLRKIEPTARAAAPIQVRYHAHLPPFLRSYPTIQSSPYPLDLKLFELPFINYYGARKNNEPRM